MKNSVLPKPKDIYYSIKDYSLYGVSPLGNVIRFAYCELNKKKEYKESKPCYIQMKSGFIGIHLCSNDGVWKVCYLSNILIKCIYNIFEGIKVIHRNKNSSDDRIQNLRIVALNDKYYELYKDNPLVYKQNKITKARLPEDILLSLIKDISNNITRREFLNKYNLSTEYLYRYRKLYKLNPQDFLFINN